MRCGYSCLEDVLSYVLRQKVKIGAIIVVQTHGRSGVTNLRRDILQSQAVAKSIANLLILGLLPNLETSEPELLSRLKLVALKNDTF
ncbi:MAG: hypothetical protein D3916_16260 [Candidatus Electrothrix sp. MAN1_4]|nr:hypothetical protein [Candidatus Electrothrix sp. MAN1_4]